MTRFDRQTEEDGIINEVFRLIDDEYIYRRIQMPIEKAVQRYTFNGKEISTFESFNANLLEFIWHLQTNGYSTAFTSKQMAISEVIQLLDMGYRNAVSNGYYSAFLDAVNPEINGMENVLTQLANIIISVGKQKHIQWIYDTHIRQLDWELKKRIVSALLSEWGKYLPVNLQKLSSYQLTEIIPELMDAILTIKLRIDQSLGKIRNQF